MEHFNPILGHETTGQKFITCGEIMLRLTPPNYEKLRMASNFEASYGGSEANIALALANLGVDSTFFSVVPNNSLGKSAVRWLRSNDVHCTPMILTEPNETPSNRLGTYYLETGYGIRPSKVIYDRKHSAITEYDFSQVDLDALLEGFDWLHLSGITPALAPNCRGLIIDMLKVAKKKGLTVSFDGNFRSTLWSWEEARDFCTECLPYVDVLLGIEPYYLWKDDPDHMEEFDETYRNMFDDLREHNPDIKLVMCEPFVAPVTLPEDEYKARRTMIEQEIELMHRIAEDYNAVYVPLLRPFDEATKVREASYWIWDGIHPTEAGHGLIAHEWVNAVLPSGILGFTE